MSRRALVLCAMVMLTACSCASGSSAGGSGTGSPAASPGGSASTGLPDGFYGVDAADVVSKNQTTRFITPTPCDTLETVLSAGQWHVSGLSWQSVKVLLLSRGDQRMLLRTTGNDASCTAIIYRASPQEVALAGAATAHGTASFIPFACGASATDDKTATVSGFYDGPGDVHALVSADVALDGSAVSNVSAMVTKGPQAIVDTLSALATAENSDNPVLPPNIVDEFDQADSSQVSVHLTSKDPLTGTLTLKGLVGSQTGAVLDVTASFVCETPPG